MYDGTSTPPPPVIVTGGTPQLCAYRAGTDVSEDVLAEPLPSATLLSDAEGTHLPLSGSYTLLSPYGSLPCTREPFLSVRMAPVVTGGVVMPGEPHRHASHERFYSSPTRSYMVTLTQNSPVASAPSRYADPAHSSSEAAGLIGRCLDVVDSSTTTACCAARPVAADATATTTTKTTTTARTATSSTSRTDASYSTSSDARARRRPPRLALRLFDQPDDCDSSLDHSRTVDRTVATSSSTPGDKEDAVYFRAPLFRDRLDSQSGLASSDGFPSHGDHAMCRGGRTTPSRSPPTPPPFALAQSAEEGHAVTPQFCDEFSFPHRRRGGSPSAKATRTCTEEPRNTSRSARRRRAGGGGGGRDEAEETERELAELLSFQTPLSPCASSTAPQFSVMTSRHSTGYFSPVTTGSGHERLNSMSFGPGKRSTHRPVSSRVIVEKRLRKQQQQQQQPQSQQGGAPLSTVSSCRGSQSGVLPEWDAGTNGSFAMTCRSAQSGSPLWWVSRGVSPQSPAPVLAGVSGDGSPLTRGAGAARVPTTPLQPFSRFPSKPYSERTPLPVSSTGSARPSDVNTADPPLIVAGAGGEPCGVAHSACSSVNADAADSANAQSHTSTRRNTLDPLTSAAYLSGVSPNSTRAHGTETASDRLSRPPEDLRPQSSCSNSHSCSMPCVEATVSDASPPTGLPHRSYSPTRNGACGRPCSPRSRTSVESTRGSSPHFSASASYAALTLGKLMTPEEHPRSSSHELYASLSSFPMRSGTATPTRVRVEALRAQYERGNSAAGEKASAVAHRLQYGGDDADNDAAALSSHASADTLPSCRSRGAGSGRPSSSVVCGALTSTPIFEGQAAPALQDAVQRSYSRTSFATPPPGPVPAAARSLTPFFHEDVGEGTVGLPRNFLAAVSLDDFTLRSEDGGTLQEALRAIHQDVPASAMDPVGLPEVLHTLSSGEQTRIGSDPAQPQATEIYKTDPFRRRLSAGRAPPRTTTTTMERAPLLPLFGQISARGCRSYQEDSVLLLPEIRVNLASDPSEAAPAPPPPPYPHTAHSGAASTAETPVGGDTAPAKTFSCFGVFDGHNGDQVSTMAQQYFLDHFEVSYQHYHEEARRHRREVDEAMGRSAGSASLGELSEDSVDGDHRTLSAALVQTLLHLDVTIYDQLRSTKVDAGSTACVMACALPEKEEVARALHERMQPGEHRGHVAQQCSKDGHDEDDEEEEDDDGVYGVDYLDLAIANLGDSRAVVGNAATGTLVLETLDHRVKTYPTEEARITRCGGTVEFERVEGCYDVTRGLGDYHLKCSPTTWWTAAAATPTCEMAQKDAGPPPLEEASMLKEGRQGSSLASNGHASGEIRGNVIGNVADVYELRVGAGDFVILASDGVWDRVSSEEAVSFVAKALQPFFEACSLASTAVMAVDSPAGEAVENGRRDVSGAERLVLAGVQSTHETGLRCEEAVCETSGVQRWTGVTDKSLSTAFPRGTTLSSAGLTSVGPARSATTSSLPTSSAVRDTAFSSSPTRLAPAGKDSQPVPRIPSRGALGAADAAPHDDRDTDDDEQDEVTSAPETPKQTFGREANDEAPSPPFRIPSDSRRERRVTAKPGPELLNFATPGPATRGRRCRRLSNVDLVQRDALPTEVLERRTQQQHSNTITNNMNNTNTSTTLGTTVNGSSLLYSPSSLATRESSARHIHSVLDESDKTPLSSASAPRAGPCASQAQLTAASGVGGGRGGPWQSTPPYEDEASLIAQHTSLLSLNGSSSLPHQLGNTAVDNTCASAQEALCSTPTQRTLDNSTCPLDYQTPSRTTPGLAAKDSASTAHLAQIVRKASAGLADFALLDRNSGDNVTVVLVVFAPIVGAEACPMFSASLRGFQSP